MAFIVGLIIGFLFGFVTPVLLACIVIASESNREQEETEKKYDGW